ncbi:MAG: ATPase, T2SS/T4P/T4SS family [bacterium]|nr:ATPase, T2SS/T4P/T4SS family [bacterium]
MLPATSSRECAVFSWPLPPFFQLSGTSLEGHAHDCAIEMLDGRILGARLQRFEPEAGCINVEMAGHAGPQRLRLERVRAIRLSMPVSLILDTDMVNAAGADAAHAADESEVTVRFPDGTTLTGITCGLAKVNAGLFLYFPDGDTGLVVPCFIPAQQLDDVQIGLRMPDTLAQKDQGATEATDVALNQQEKLSEEKLGQLLLNGGITSPEDLQLAIRSRKRLPMMKLGDLLVDSDLITPIQLSEALKLQTVHPGKRLGDILVGMGAVTMRLVQMALSEKLGVPFVNVRDFQTDPLALDLVSAAVATQYQALPLMRVESALVVAMENPLAMDFVQKLQFLSKHTIVPVIGDPDDLRDRISKEYASLELASAIARADTSQAHPSENLRSKDVTQMKVEELTSALTRETLHPAESKDREVEEARVMDNALVRLLNKIIIDAHTQGASDIHIESNAGKTNTLIRFRKDGDLEDYLELQPTYRNALVSRIKIMAGLDISERRHAQDGKISFGHFGQRPIELRVAIVPTIENLEDVVLRILGGVDPLPLQALGLDARDFTELKKMVARSYGLFLVCGPTGSGKTTTLHSVLHHINKPDIKIWTAEDPVEITQPGLRQVQINSRIDWTFAAAMRAFLRADPDVIMVGEIRDAETAKIAIEASLTGHLILSTLHTNSAAESVVRLLDLGMDPFNFADALIGILSQRLARKLCQKCKQPHAATNTEISEMLDEYCAGTSLNKPAVLAAWRKDFAPEGQFVLYEPAGCDACHAGYKGRVGVYELLGGSDEVKQLVRSRATVPQIVRAGCDGGMRLLRQDAIEKVLSGLLDRVSARAVSS